VAASKQVPPDAAPGTSPIGVLAGCPAASPDGSTIYAGGDFVSINGDTIQKQP
jgi:hypothetical protein